MLEVEHLTVSYGAHRALEDVSVRVSAGEICVILGANGAGKSTLLKAMAGGVIRGAPGARITIDGQNITRAKPHKVVEAGLALVPEGRGIFGDLTVAENLQLGAYGPQARTGELERRTEILKLFPRLAERRDQIVRTMSGGEQQMVAIGRALMSNPTILMLDEPSLGLSPLLTKDLFKSLKAVGKTGVGILLVEQNAKQSLAIADRGYLIENGHITGEGTGAELARDPAVQAAYLGGAAAAPDDRRDQSNMPGGMPYDTSVSGIAGETTAAARREHCRPRVPSAAVRGGINGYGHELAEKLAQNGDAINMSDQAHELSRQAVEMATRAARIQREHVDALRAKPSAAPDRAMPQVKTASATGAAPTAGELGKQAALLAERAAAIHCEHIAKERAAGPIATLDGKKLKGRGKKLARKAEKLARKAEKLAAKAIRAGK